VADEDEDGSCQYGEEEENPDATEFNDYPKHWNMKKIFFRVLDEIVNPR